MNFIKRWKERRDLRRRQRGYEYAAGVLLKDGWVGYEYLGKHACMISDFDDYDEFDRGVEEAMFAYNKLVGSRNES